MSSKPREQIKSEILDASKKVVSSLAMQAQTEAVMSHPMAESPISALQSIESNLAPSLDLLLRINAQRSEILELQWEATIEASTGDILPYDNENFEQVLAAEDISRLPPHERIVVQYLKKMRTELKRILAE